LDTSDQEYNFFVRHFHAPRAEDASNETILPLPLAGNPTLVFVIVIAFVIEKSEEDRLHVLLFLASQILHAKC